MKPKATCQRILIEMRINYRKEFLKVTASKQSQSESWLYPNVMNLSYCSIHNFQWITIANSLSI